MINICIADNEPVVLHGLSTFFHNHKKISIVNQVSNFDSLLHVLKDNKIDVVIFDLDLEGLAKINDLKSTTDLFSETKFMLFSALSEKVFTLNVLKAGVCGFVAKTASLADVESAVLKMVEGEIVVDKNVKQKLDYLAGQDKSDRLYRKISTREIEVLRYLAAGKKNKEVAEILGLDEKTISTYKLRLLAKLNVTNLVDLINKAKMFDIV